MAKRITLISTLLLSLVIVPGCPGAGQFVGTWTVTVGVTDYGVTLNANGTATAFALGNLFTGDLTWEANGDVLTINRDVNDNQIRYIGQVINNATTGGYVIWSGPGTGAGGSWSAVKQ